MSIMLSYTIVCLIISSVLLPPGESVNCFNCIAIEGDPIECKFDRFFCPGRDSQCATMITTTIRDNDVPYPRKVWTFCAKADYIDNKEAGCSEKMTGDDVFNLKVKRCIEYCNTNGCNYPFDFVQL